MLGSRVPLVAGSIEQGPGTAMVRPESVALDADGVPNATVTSVNFLGPVSRVHLEVDGAGALMAAVASALAVGLSPGDRIRVHVEPTPLLVVPPTP